MKRAMEVEMIPSARFAELEQAEVKVDQQEAAVGRLVEGVCGENVG